MDNHPEKDHVSGSTGRLFAVLLIAVGVLGIPMTCKYDANDVVTPRSNHNGSSHHSTRPCARAWQYWVVEGGSIVMGARMWWIASAILRAERKRSQDDEA